ncbi:MAG: branched-chain amino acid ABC transporter permease [Clostridia bacterium]|nr:branched-chain amino acid ABC transporter permease [Clostridia bacterium]
MKDFLKNVKWKHYINYIAVAAFALIFGIIGLAGGLKGSTEYMLEKFAIAIILAVSLNVVVGFLGELSLGHAGFMCVGAYIGGKVASLLDKGADNIGVLLLAVMIGGSVAAVFGFIIGLPALRLRGDYLAIVTLAFGEIVRTIFMNTSSESFGGTLGLRTPRYDSSYLFIFGFILVLICLAVTQNMMRSKHGRAITAIRDNEIAARATGVNVTKYKLIAFTVSAFFAGVAGVLYSHSNYTVQSSVFDYNYSIEILVMVVLGGMGSINGSIIAATLITFLNLQLSTVLTGDLAVLKNLIYAVILVLIVIYNNAPALKHFRERYNLRALLDKIIKRKKDPSDQKDDEGAWDRVPTKIEMNELLSTDIIVTESVQDPDKGGKS